MSAKCCGSVKEKQVSKIKILFHLSKFFSERRDTMKVTISEFVFIGLLSFSITSGQVCSPPGQLCTRTTDCCKGCCEAHTCVDRPFSCSTDLIKQPGFSSCIGYFCPMGQMCYLREVCPPENPCARQPACRRVDTKYNYSDWQYRNSIQRTQAIPLHFYFSIVILIVGFMGCAYH